MHRFRRIVEKGGEVMQKYIVRAKELDEPSIKELNYALKKLDKHFVKNVIYFDEGRVIIIYAIKVQPQIDEDFEEFDEEE